MSKDDYITLIIATGTEGAHEVTIKATKAGRSVKLSQNTAWTVAQELKGGGGAVVHEVKTRTKNIIATEKWFRN